MTVFKQWIECSIEESESIVKEVFKDVLDAYKTLTSKCFEVSRIEQKMAKTFIKERLSINPQKVDRFAYSFMPTKDGVIISIIDLVTGMAEDITDYESW